jgi:hypothetical protein
LNVAARWKYIATGGRPSEARSWMRVAGARLPRRDQLVLSPTMQRTIDSAANAAGRRPPATNAARRAVVDPIQGLDSGRGTQPGCSRAMRAPVAGLSPSEIRLAIPRRQVRRAPICQRPEVDAITTHARCGCRSACRDTSAAHRLRASRTSLTSSGQQCRQVVTNAAGPGPPASSRDGPKARCENVCRSPAGEVRHLLHDRWFPPRPGEHQRRPAARHHL